MVAGQRKPEGQWTEDERKAQRLKSLIMSVLLDDQMNSDINCLTAKSTWDDLILYHEGLSDVKESRVMDLKLCYNTFKFKEGESLTQTFTRYKALMNELVNDGIKLSKLEINTGFINGLPKKWLNIIYEIEKNKSLVSATPLSTAFFSTSIIQGFQDSPDDEKDTRSSHEYLNDLEEEYQARALLAKSKRFFKKELRPTKDFEAKYNKVKAKLTLLSSSASASKASTCISEQIPSQKKRILGVDQLTKDPYSSWQKDLVFVKSSADDTKVSIPGVERPWLSEAEGFILPNHDTGRILPAESQRNTTDPSVAVSDSSSTNYDSADESSVCSNPLPLLKKLGDAKFIFRPKTIKLILRLKSTFKAKTLKGVILNEPSSALAKDNKSSSASKVNSAPAGKLKSVKIENDPPLAIVIKELNNLKLQFSKIQSSYSISNKLLQVP
ncbi:hypothetical protein Tco_0575140 [Tanacetum coccineum]